jgi:hypothetical protein
VPCLCCVAESVPDSVHCLHWAAQLGRWKREWHLASRSARVYCVSLRDYLWMKSAWHAQSQQVIAKHQHSEMRRPSCYPSCSWQAYSHLSLSRAVLAVRNDDQYACARSHGRGRSNDLQLAAGTPSSLVTIRILNCHEICPTGGCCAKAALLSRQVAARSGVVERGTFEVRTQVKARTKSQKVFGDRGYESVSSGGDSEAQGQSTW